LYPLREEVGGGVEEPVHLSEYITKWGAVGTERAKTSRAFSSRCWVGAAKPPSPEKRATMAAMIGSRIKTMIGTPEVKKPETVVSPSSKPPPFYTETQKSA